MLPNIAIRKEDNLGDSNVDNAVCLPNLVGGKDDKQNTVLGISLKSD